MGMIRRYGKLPALFVPDEGEVVLISRSVAGPYLRAVVLRVRRRAEGMVRVDFEWRESSERSATGEPIRVGDKGNVYVSLDDPIARIRRIPA